MIDRPSLCSFPFTLTPRSSSEPGMVVKGGRNFGESCGSRFYFQPTVVGWGRNWALSLLIKGRVDCATVKRVASYLRRIMIDKCLLSKYLHRLFCCFPIMYGQNSGALAWAISGRAHRRINQSAAVTLCEKWKIIVEFLLFPRRSSLTMGLGLRSCKCNSCRTSHPEHYYVNLLVAFFGKLENKLPGERRMI